MHQNQPKLAWADVLERGPLKTGGIELCGLSGTAVPYALGQLIRHWTSPILLVTRHQKDAERLLDELKMFLGEIDRPLLYFPPYHLIAYKQLAFHNETAASRIRTLYQLLEGQQASLTITTVSGVLQKLLPKEALVDFSELLLAGEEVDRDDLVRKLVSGGYTRTALVEEHGDFSVRGGILDIFSPLYDEPLRIEFFGDLIESIRHFSADTQRTLNDVNEAVILPAREAILRHDQLKSITGRIRTLASQIELPVTRVRQVMSQIKEEGLYSGLESLLPLIYPRLNTVFDYCTGNTLTIL